MTNARQVLALFAAATTAAQVQAQNIAQPVEGLDDIVVTAQKREESLQKVPISIVSLSIGKLADLNIQRFTDIGFAVPNLRLSQHPTTAFSTRLFIRGIGNNDAQITQDPAVGIYQDGVYIARSTGLAFDFGDVERVEVLRGPQGTLYGRNTTGGAISIVSRRPSGEPALSGEIGYGSRNFLRAVAHADLPRFGMFKTRLSALHAQRGGLVENDGAGKDFGAYRRWGLRAAVEADLSDRLNAFVTYDHSVEKAVPYYYQAGDVVGGPPFFYESFIPAAARRVKRAALAAPVRQSRLGIDGLAATLAWDASDTLTVKAITGYRRFHARAYADFSGNPVATLFRTNPQDTHHRQFSEELQLIGSAFDRKLEYIVGAYYFSERARQTEDYDAGAFIISQRFVAARNKAQALFANATWAFADHVKLTLGARYSWDQRRATKNNIDFTLPDPVTGTPPDHFVGTGRRSFSKFNPSASLAWQPNDDLNLYAKVVTGYRAGGYGTGSASRADFERGFNAENLLSYEAGLKLQGWNRRLQFNSAVFYSRYKDILIDLAVLGQPQFVASFNAGRARIYGAEFDLTLLLIEGLKLEFGYAYLNARYTRVRDPQSGADVTALFKFANAPRHSFTVAATQQLGRVGSSPLELSLSYGWQDKVVTTAPYIERPGARIGAYGLLNGRISIREIAVGNSRFDIGLWGRNLTGVDYPIDSVGSFPWSTNMKAYGEPLTMGLDLGFTF